MRAWRPSYIFWWPPVDNHLGMPADRIVVSVGAVVEDGDGRVLLVKHVPERRGFWQGRWIFPGGKLQVGESVAAGIRREVREETNLDVEVTTPLPVVERIVKDGDRIPLHVLYITYMARRISGKLRPASDVGQARWVTRDELRELWFELHEDTRPIARNAGLL